MARLLLFLAKVPALEEAVVLQVMIDGLILQGVHVQVLYIRTLG